MITYSVTGHLVLKPDGTVEGWVWSSDWPDQRFVVEILVNGTCVGTMTAAMFRRDLFMQGIGDGRHGYRLSLPGDTIPPSGPVEISVREQASQQVFARVVREGPVIAPQHREALERGAERLQELWAGLETLHTDRPRTSRADQVRGAFAQLSAVLAARARVRDEAVPLAPAVALEALRRAARPCCLPLIGRPALSVIMPAGREVHAALRRLASLAPVLTEAEAEILLIDDGADPAIALLPALVPNLVYVHLGSADMVADSLSEAARIARGSAVAVLELTPREPSASALLALGKCMATAPRTVLLGPLALAACRRVGLPATAPPDCPAPARLGLRIALARDLLVQAGGFEPAMADGAALESAELWMRCRLLGAEALAWREPAGLSGEADTRHEYPQAELRALAAFRQRWPVSKQ